MSDRVQKVLSRAGIASRREGERLLLAGRLTIDGRTVTQLGTRLFPGEHLAVDGRPVRVPVPTYLLMYKPRGCLTTLADPEARPTVREYLPRTGPRVFPVGRLDYASEGLLLFTNDGDLAQALMRPAGHLPKTYLVKVRGVPDPRALSKLRQPFRLGGRPTRQADVQVVRARGNAVLRVTLTEGRKNQIREMCWRVGHPVRRLRRIAIGPISDESLGAGATRELTPAEVASLRALVEDSHHAPSIRTAQPRTARQ